MSARKTVLAALLVFAGTTLVAGAALAQPADPNGPFGVGGAGGLRGTPRDNGTTPPATEPERSGPFTPGVDGPVGPYTPGTIDSPRTDGPYSPSRERTRDDGWGFWSGVKSVVQGIFGVVRQVSEIIYTIDAIRNVAEWFGGLFERSPRDTATATLPQNGFGANPGRNDATAVGGPDTPVVVRTANDSPMVVVNPSRLADENRTSVATGAPSRTAPLPARIPNGGRALTR